MRTPFVSRFGIGSLGLVLTFGVSACGGGDDEMGPDPAPEAITIVMTNLTFSPQVDTVAVGGTVTWRNDDPFDHNTTADGGQWASDDFGQGGTFEHTLTTAGSYPYECTLHEGMTGTIVVK